MNEHHSIRYGTQTVEFEMERRDRTTLQITVEPSGMVRVVAPLNTAIEDVRDRVAKRARWIIARRSYFAQFEPRTPSRRHIPGETHLYLGRQYRLTIGPDGDRGVSLGRGELIVRGVERDDSSLIEVLLRDWYRDRAAAVFGRRLSLNLERFGTRNSPAPQDVRLRRMPQRWGSMSASGTLTLNPDLVRASAGCIDYVITHELCHVRIARHSPEFYELLGNVMPGWPQHKLRLERMLA